MRFDLLLALLVSLASVACAPDTAASVDDPLVQEVIALVDANTVPDASPASPAARAVLVGERRASTLADRLQLAGMQASLPTLTPEMRKALRAQRALLQRQRSSKTYVIDGLELRPRDFMQVIDDLLSGAYLTEPLDGVSVSYQEPVKFTGYYSPEVRVRSKRSRKYRYPILAYPKDHDGPLPVRSAIEGGKALPTEKLAIAWAAHALDVYTLQLQGSGFVRFEDGQRRYLAYAGTNRYPYQSIELALSRRDSTVTDLSLRGLREWVSAAPNVRDTITRFNPNYGFFKLSDGAARGAAGLALQPMISVAADPEFYPLGSVLIANVPVVNQPGTYRTQLLLVQDTGGAIKGSRHLDLYTGVGEAALDVAERTSMNGEVFLLSPR